MKERPIIFDSESVRAILAGTKSQTRRVVKRAKMPECNALMQRPQAFGEGTEYFMDMANPMGPYLQCNCPYGAPGDVLWAKETWQYADWNEDGESCIRYAADGAKSWRVVPDHYSDRAQHEWERLSQPENYNIDKCAADRCWRASMFMPRWASRITRGIVAVRVERLQDIGEADAIAEGMKPRPAEPYDCMDDPREQFRFRWDSINAKRAPWASNPWVWVVEFGALEAKR